jgi:hypothetical protein
MAAVDSAQRLQAAAAAAAAAAAGATGASAGHRACGPPAWARGPAELLLGIPLLRNWRAALTERLPRGLSSREGPGRAAPRAPLARVPPAARIAGGPFNPRYPRLTPYPPPIAPAALGRMASGRAFVAGAKIWAVLSALLVASLAALHTAPEVRPQVGNLVQAYVAAVLAMSERAEATASKVGCQDTHRAVPSWAHSGCRPRLAAPASRQPRPRCRRLDACSLRPATPPPP